MRNGDVAAKSAGDQAHSEKFREHTFPSNGFALPAGQNHEK